MALREFAIETTTAGAPIARTIALASSPAEAIRIGRAVWAQLAALQHRAQQLDVVDVEIGLTVWRWTPDDPEGS